MSRTGLSALAGFVASVACVALVAGAARGSEAAERAARERELQRVRFDEVLSCLVGPAVRDEAQARELLHLAALGASEQRPGTSYLRRFERCQRAPHELVRLAEAGLAGDARLVDRLAEAPHDPRIESSDDPLPLAAPFDVRAFDRLADGDATAMRQAPAVSDGVAIAIDGPRPALCVWREDEPYAYREARCARVPADPAREPFAPVPGSAGRGRWVVAQGRRSELFDPWTLRSAPLPRPDDVWTWFSGPREGELWALRQRPLHQDLSFLAPGSDAWRVIIADPVAHLLAGPYSVTASLLESDPHTARVRALLPGGALGPEATVTLPPGAGTHPTGAAACIEGTTRALFIGNDAGTAIYFESEGAWEGGRVVAAPFLSAKRSCGFGRASLSWLEPSRGDGLRVIGRAACSPAECTGTRDVLRVHDERHLAYADVEGAVAVVARAADGSWRLQVGPPGAVSHAPQRVLIDAPRWSGVQVEEVVFEGRGAHGVLVFATDVGVVAFHVGPHGEVTPVRRTS